MTYYPFGLTINEGQSATVIPNKYLYQGKEMQDQLGMNLYDFHARQYDPQIGRFWSVDPASQFPSGYTGMGNDPGNQIDPTGAWSNVVNSGETSGAGGRLTGRVIIPAKAKEKKNMRITYLRLMVLK